jgi:zinc protease
MLSDLFRFFMGKRTARRAAWEILAVVMTALLCGVPARAAATAPNSGESSVVRATLPNGLRVVIVPNPLAPVVTTVVNYQVGSNEAPADFPGMAHAQEHMMFRGNPGLSADQLAEISAAMGGRFDADTQQVVTQYFFTVPAEDLNVALHIESLRMKGADDSAAEWAKERGAIEQEVVQDLSNPQYLYYTRLLQAMFHGTPYAHDALGTRPSFEKTTAAMLQKFYAAWYAPNNAILVIVGNVEPAAVLKDVKVMFGGIPSKKLPGRPAVELGGVEAESLNLKTDLPYGLAVVAFRMPGYGSPDFAAAQVLADTLDSQRGSLYALVPAGKALYAGFEMSQFPQTGLGFAVGAFAKGQDGAKLRDEVSKVLDQTVKEGVSAALVEAAKRQELTAAELEKNSVFGLAMAWSNALAVEHRQSPEDDLRAIERVTVQDVNRVARQYLLPQNAVLAVLTPQASGAPVSRHAFGGQESFAPQHPKLVPLAAWAQSALQRLALPPATSLPTVSRLSNGLQLIVLPESVSDTISVYGHIRNNPDLETPQGQEGVSDVLSDLFSYGTPTLGRLAFQKALDDIGAQESAGTDFSLHVLASHFDRGVELLADNELHPALPAQAFGVVRQQVTGEVAGRLHSPQYLAHRALDAALFPKSDPVQRQATPATVSALTLAQVQQYYQRVFRPDLATLVVIGKVTPEEARSVIAKYFSDWKAAGPQPPTLLPPAPRNKPSTVAVPDQSRIQDRVTLAETLPLVRSHPDYYALELGNHVLGGGFYATRLYRDLRENAGLVYFVGSSFNVGRTRGIYEVNYGCDPDKVSKARSLIERDLKQMQDAPVDASEFDQAKAMLLREIPLAEASLGEIANGLLERVRLGLPLDEPTRAARRYLTLTPAQVQAAYRKWLRVEDLAQVSVGPAPK